MKSSNSEQECDKERVDWLYQCSFAELNHIAAVYRKLGYHQKANEILNNSADKSTQDEKDNRPTNKA